MEAGLALHSPKQLKQKWILANCFPEK
jgi:hypothetical protein